ncbi:peptide-binding protein [Paenibacillus sp. AR247]|uniref:peptide-binding protein n=1 Tax=Paenibacillus sp. AR247 TaxID=1631599 RepID=UPI000CFA0024|nr:peptide-binding protein [Paenibacillus sp. AR247]PQP86419.1 peptide ABC transporter substrate-binding protein [Paenibacillus sp. AR247]
MTSKKKWLSLLVSLSVVSTLFVGCGSKDDASSTPKDEGNKESSTNTGTEGTKEATGPVDGGTLTYGSFSDIVSVNPLFVQDTASGDAAEFMYAKLYDINRTGEVVAEPWSLAAEPMTISEDGLTYTIKLKDSAKWSDGEAITADDVVFTFNSIKDPKVGSPGMSGFDKVTKVEKVDDLTVKITLKQVYAPFQYVLSTQIVPEHILKDVKPEELQKNVYGTDPAKTVSSGPWVWKEWKQKQYLSFERNPNYWGPKPHIDKIVYKIYADQNTEVQALIKGDVDLLGGIPVTQVDAVKSRDGLTVIQEPGPQYEYLGFNFNPDNFKDKFVPWAGQKTRQAIAYALNRQGMIDNVLKGTGKLMNAPFLPGSWADPGDAAVNYAFDPEKAKQLLAEDGWTAGSDGILTKDGHRFSFELQYNSGNSRREQVASVIQQNLKDVGIEVVPKALDFAAWVDQNLTPGKYPAILMGWSLNNPDPDGETTFSSKYFPPAGQNQGFYKNEKLDKLWEEGTAVVDQEKRKEIYKQIGQEISTDLPYVFMYQYGTPTAYNSSKVKFAEEDAPESSLAYGYFFHLINWWVDAK